MTRCGHRPRAAAAGLLAACAALAACSGPAPEPAPTDRDPAISGALGQQLMTDPDLARINAENRVLAGGGPASAPIPDEDRSPDAIARARGEAARLAGGGLARAPAPQAAAVPDLAAAPTMAQAALAALGSGAAGCAQRLADGFIWAARMPPAVPIYPRGHAQQAAGVDGGGCKLRAVQFVTPVPAGEVTDFYWTAATRAGMTARHRAAGGASAIAMRKGAAAALAEVRPRSDGLTGVFLVTSGF